MTFPLLAASLLACRPEPGQPQYPVYEPWDGGEGNGALPGPFPYVEGEDRLSLGFFYEGGASETALFDNYFIYESTYSQTISDERIEGLQSDVLTISGAQVWWGGGLFWDTARDLSSWTTLHVSFRATDAAFEGMEIEVIGGSAGRVSPFDYGFLADGEWHSLAIPLGDFSGVAFTTVTTPASFVAGAGTPDTELFIDDLYFTKE
jgi:hypothetical protein